MEFVVPPLLWWVALPALLLAVYAWAQTRRAPSAVQFSSVRLLRAALAGRPSTAGRRHVPPVVMALGLALAAVALARPALRTPVPKDRATIILVLDISGSMASSDVFPSRLAAAKSASKRFVGELPPDFRVGVVSFSSTASLVQPVTEDHAAVRDAIDQLKTEGGTAIGEAIVVALASIPPEDMNRPSQAAAPLPTPPGAPGAPAAGQAPAPPPAIILLLTDGENTEGVPPLDATAKAKEANVPVFTVGMGSRSGVLGRGRGGGIDEALLREIAAQTGGQYYFAPSGGELSHIYGDLGLAMGWDFIRREIGQYFAAAAAVVSAAGMVLAFLWLHRQP